MINEVNTPDSRPFDGYEEFAASIQKTFDKLVGDYTPIFIVNAENLFDTFLENLPEEGRQHYNCHACRSFINRYGGLVTISPDGQIIPLLWDTKVPKFFTKSVSALRERIIKSKVDTVFITTFLTLGTPETRCWSHLHLRFPRNRVSMEYHKNPDQIMAEYRVRFRTLLNAVLDFSMDHARNAYNLLSPETWYRSDTVLNISKFFYELKESLEGTTGKIRDNIIWRAVATVPGGFCHIKSSVLGAMLKDIADGLSVPVIRAKFEEKMDPTTYGRSQTAPSAAAIAAAEKVVAELGVADSLARRYARFTEIPAEEFIWTPKEIRSTQTKTGSGVFSNITPRDKQESAPARDLIPSAIMTWNKFVRTVLPAAVDIEASADPSHLMALVTAANNGVPNILQWDNPFSWYYRAGIDAEIKRRVEEAGGRYENNEIRCSLIWGTRTDLDLHCITPCGNHIYYANKKCGGGYLDVDMNVHGETDKPVENIRFQNNAPQGRYSFYVHNFRNRSPHNTFKVELEVGGRVYTYEGNLTGFNTQEDVFAFNYIKGQEPKFIGATKHGSIPVVAWGTSEFTRVKGIVKSPNLWGSNEVTHVGQHIFFLLDGCKDESAGEGKGFFTEMLRAELRPIRRTLDAFTNSTAIMDAESADACGIGFSTDTEWNLMLRVKTTTGTQLIKIDRFD